MVTSLNECSIAPSWKEFWSLLVILSCLDKSLSPPISEEMQCGGTVTTISRFGN